MKINMYRTPVTDEMKHCKMTRWTTKCIKFKTASSSCEDTCEAQSLCLKHGSAAVKQQSEAAQETAVRSSTGNSSQKQHRKQQSEAAQETAVISSTGNSSQKQHRKQQSEAAQETKEMIPDRDPHATSSMADVSITHQKQWTPMWSFLCAGSPGQRSEQKATGGKHSNT